MDLVQDNDVPPARSQRADKPTTRSRPEVSFADGAGGGGESNARSARVRRTGGTSKRAKQLDVQELQPLGPQTGLPGATTRGRGVAPLQVSELEEYIKHEERGVGNELPVSLGGHAAGDMSIVLPVDIATIEAGTSARASFDQELMRDLAQIAGVEGARVSILSVRPGTERRASVVVDLNVAAAPGGAGLSPSAAVQRITGQLLAGGVYLAGVQPSVNPQPKLPMLGRTLIPGGKPDHVSVEHEIESSRQAHLVQTALSKELLR